MARRKSMDYEREMDSVTVKPPRGEVLVEPRILSEVFQNYSGEYMQGLEECPEMIWERWDQIERLRFIAARKLEGRNREAILMLLSAGFSQRRMSELLGLARNTLRKHVENAEKILREHVEKAPIMVFPGSRKDGLKTVVFSVDTEEERARFQEFVNENEVQHISYTGNGDLRAVMVLFR